MDEMTNTTVLNVYEEDLKHGNIEDYSSQNLFVVPHVKNNQLCVLYLQQNNIESLPNDFFPSLPQLMWLDIRDNKLNTLPSSIEFHSSLTHLLLQNNNIESLPNELGTVPNLKVLQLQGNPLTYPSKDILRSGVHKILAFLNGKYVDHIFNQTDVSVSVDSTSQDVERESIEQEKDEEKNCSNKVALSISFSEKDLGDVDDVEYYSKIKGKCPRLERSRIGKVSVPKDLKLENRNVKIEHLKQLYFKETALKKHKELLASREKIIQDRKNIEVLKNWRSNYRRRQFSINTFKDYKLEQKAIPYDTTLEYMTLLSREDIEKDLPDKYRRNLIRKSRPSAPRKNGSDAHLAIKIKQLFANLEAINVNRSQMTPRTEQKMLMGEIQKISEIKQKLIELSLTNMNSVDS